jgi:SNF2 family DNA or RNA helicase
MERKGEVVDEEKIIEMWQQLYTREVGPLHQIKFLRIILDEGHLIKNHLTSVSIAVRALTGYHKWILSGTPVPK